MKLQYVLGNPRKKKASKKKTVKKVAKKKAAPKTATKKRTVKKTTKKKTLKRRKNPREDVQNFLFEDGLDATVLNKKKPKYKASVANNVKNYVTNLLKRNTGKTETNSGSNDTLLLSKLLKNSANSGDTKTAIVVKDLIKTAQASNKGVKKVAKRRRKKRVLKPSNAAIAKTVKVGVSKRQKYGKKKIKTLRKGGLFKVKRKHRSVVMKRTNPMVGALESKVASLSTPSVGLGSFFTTGYTKNELITLIAAGFGAPFISSLAARVPFLNKLQAIPTYGVPAILTIAGGVIAAKGKTANVQNIGKALVAVGIVNLGGSIARMVTAGKGGVSGMMGDLLGYDGMEGYDGEEMGDDMGDYGESVTENMQLEGDDMGLVPSGLNGVDFTPNSRTRPFGFQGEDMGDHMGHAGHMAGVDFTPQSRVRPFGAIPEGLSGRDGADFGSDRDGTDFGGMA